MFLSVAKLFIKRKSSYRNVILNLVLIATIL